MPTLAAIDTQTATVQGEIREILEKYERNIRVLKFVTLAALFKRKLLVAHIFVVIALFPISLLLTELDTHAVAFCYYTHMLHV